MIKIQKIKEGVEIVRNTTILPKGFDEKHRVTTYKDNKGTICTLHDSYLKEYGWNGLQNFNSDHAVIIEHGFAKGIFSRHYYNRQVKDEYENKNI